MGLIVRRPRAENDLVDIWVCIAHESPSAADRVLDAIAETLNVLSETPEIGIRHESAIKRLAGIRFFPAKRYRRFLIYYRPLPDGIDVIRVLRAERDRAKLLEES